MLLEKKLYAIFESLALPNEPFGVAVSGGVDSMVLSHVLLKWRPACVTLFHINHGLRPTSYEESQKLSLHFKNKGHDLHILKWAPPKMISGIMNEARKARYALLENACEKMNIKNLFLAHHQDDHIETFFLRLLMSSGLKGLTGIQPVSFRGSLKIIRPLLGVFKEDIENYANQNEIFIMEDPSNHNQKFKRVYIRKNLFLNRDEKSNICRSLKKLSSAEEALEFYTQAVFQKVKEESGNYYIPMEVFLDNPIEIGCRLINKLVQLDYKHPCRFETLVHIVESIRNQSIKGITLRGHLITLSRGIVRVRKGLIIGNKTFFKPVTLTKPLATSREMNNSMARNSVDNRVLFNS